MNDNPQKVGILNKMDVLHEEDLLREAIEDEDDIKYSDILSSSEKYVENAHIQSLDEAIIH